MEITDLIVDKCFVGDIVYIETEKEKGTWHLHEIKKELGKVILIKCKDDLIVEKCEADSANVIRSETITLSDIYFFLEHIVVSGPMQNILIDNVFEKIAQKDFIRMRHNKQPNKNIKQNGLVRNEIKRYAVENKIENFNPEEHLRRYVFEINEDIEGCIELFLTVFNFF